MTPEQRQTALQRHRAILLATLDYLLAKNGGSIVFDQIDTIAEYYEQQRLQVEKYYTARKLTNLQQQLSRLTRGLQNRTDLAFAVYIKEKTGYEIDIFEDLRKRVDAIIAHGAIKSEKESNDVGNLLQFYQQTSADSLLIDRLQELHMKYHHSPDRKSKGYTEITSTVEQDGVKIVDVSYSTGPKPKHYVEEETMSPDGKRRLRVVRWGDGKNATTFVSIIFPTASGGIYGAPGIHPEVKAFWKDNATIVIELPKNIPTHTQHKEVRSFEDVIAIEYITSPENI